MRSCCADELRMISVEEVLGTGEERLLTSVTVVTVSSCIPIEGAFGAAGGL